MMAGGRGEFPGPLFRLHEEKLRSFAARIRESNAARNYVIALKELTEILEDSKPGQKIRQNADVYRDSPVQCQKKE